jgi:hypothetical protein
MVLVVGNVKVEVGEQVVALGGGCRLGVGQLGVGGHLAHKTPHGDVVVEEHLRQSATPQGTASAAAAAIATAAT